MNLKLKIKNSSGQVALIVLLISAVVMTMGLSVVKKTVVDTKVETDQQKLKQAFNVAESGVEYYLGTGSTQFLSSDKVSRADVVVKQIGVGATVNFNQYALVNSNVGYWLAGHTATGAIDYATFYTGTSLSLCIESTFTGSLAVDYFYLDVGLNYKVQRFGYNYLVDYIHGFTNVSPLPPTGVRCIANYREQVISATLTGGVKPLLLVVKPLRTGVSMYLLGSGQTFPGQGIEIASTGRVGDVTSTTASVSRKLSVDNLYQIPAFALDTITTFGNVLNN